jgi:putative ATP-binding cassette transporter
MQPAAGETDNPDQRIAEDLQLFVSATLGLAIGVLRAVVTLLSIIPILWGLSGSRTRPASSWRRTPKPSGPVTSL